MTDGKVNKEDLKVVLKRLRSERKDQVTAAQQSHKVLSGLRRKVKKALADGPQTVPTLAAAVEASTDEVLWHLAAMRAYGLVAEDEQDGDYFKYRLVPANKKGG